MYMGQRDVPRYFRVLYSRHLTQKRKIFHDGFLNIKPDRSAVLLDEEGRVLANARTKGTISGESEGITCFSGLLVNCDGECSAEDIPKLDQKGKEGQKKKVSVNRRPPPLPKCEAAAPRVGLKKKRRDSGDSQEEIRKQCCKTDGPQRTDEEVLDLFLNPESQDSCRPAVIKAGQKPFSCRTTGEGKQSHKGFKRPSAKQKNDDTPFDSTKLDLRFQLFGKKMERVVSIPDSFANHEAYTQRWKAAIHEEMQLKLESFSGKLRMTLKSLDDEKQHAAADKSETQKPTPSTASTLRRHGIEYYDDCGINVFKKDKREDDLFFLEIRGMTEDTKKNARRHDLWVVSSDPFFMLKRTSYGRRAFDRMRGPWIAVFCSTWYGITREGKVQLDLLSKQRPWQGSDKVYAVHGPSIGLEMSIWEALDHTDLISETLMQALITRNPNNKDEDSVEGTCLSLRVEKQGSCLEASTELDDIFERFRLNEDQKKAVHSISRWFPSDRSLSHDQSSPVCLIHGPFGTGKSSLLVAIIQLLATACHNEEENPCRILMCAHTNKAVDRVMEGLLASRFTDFIRVGLIAKISTSILPHSLYYASESNEEGSAATELKRQLRYAQNPIEEAILRTELNEVEQGIVHKRREKLSSARVVGVTCCSTNSALLQGQTFDVVILDEACQIIEPLSLLPLIKTEAKYLIAAGDPCQLPPVIAQPAELASSKHGMLRGLFSRLQGLGHVPHLLRRQYRCHPDISKIPNEFFYDGKLLNGCSADDRAAMIPGWPALCHVQAAGTATRDLSSGSYWNKPEALAVVDVLKIFSKHNLLGHDIGVICFFRSQVKLISSLLDNNSESVQVATVDSFQGMERNVIILSMSVDVSGVFASDVQRLNVALTRGKRHLIIVGDRSGLPKLSPCMACLLEHSTTLSI